MGGVCCSDKNKDQSRGVENKPIKEHKGDKFENKEEEKMFKRRRQTNAPNMKNFKNLKQVKNIFDIYEFKEQLGKGSFGKVMKATRSGSS